MSQAISMPQDQGRQAFEGLLSPVLELAYRYAYRLAGNRDDAMDLIQDASVAAFRGFKTFTPGTNFRAWFFKILTNRHYSRPKAGRTNVSIEEAPDLFLYEKAKRDGVDFTDDPAAQVLGQMDSDQIQNAIDHLPEEYRVVAVLYFLSEMPYEEIAETLDIPLGTVRSRLHRARKMLQVSLWRIAEERGYVSEKDSAAHV